MTNDNNDLYFSEVILNPEDEDWVHFLTFLQNYEGEEVRLYAMLSQAKRALGEHLGVEYSQDGGESRRIH